MIINNDGKTFIVPATEVIALKIPFIVKTFMELSKVLGKASTLSLYGATTFSIMTFRIMVLSIMGLFATVSIIGKLRFKIKESMKF